MTRKETGEELLAALIAEGNLRLKVQRMRGELRQNSMAAYWREYEALVERRNFLMLTFMEHPEGLDASMDGTTNPAVGRDGKVG